MIEIYKYTPEIKLEWDNLIHCSKNGTFLLLRDYMDYHSERYFDCSFVFMKKNRIIAAIPGNIDEQKYYSHQGLTYGGIISSEKVTATEMKEIFQILNIELQVQGINEVFYKSIPYIYHRNPSQEDIYALFNLGAIKNNCNISSVIYHKSKNKFSELRKRGIKKALKVGISITESEQFDTFWEMLIENLREKYSTSPVHSLKEIEQLKSIFPDNIKLYLALNEGEPVAGVVVFITTSVVRAQYISSNENGKKIGALDFLFNFLINEIYDTIPYFDLGTSNGNGGYYLNENLIFQKEGIGGRGIVYESYSYKIPQSLNL